MMCSCIHFQFVLSRKPARHVMTGKTKTRRRIQRVSEKTVLQLTRSEIPPDQNDMPCDALQRGGGNHRLGRFNEHFNAILRKLPGWVNKFAPLVR